MNNPIALLSTLLPTLLARLPASLLATLLAGLIMACGAASASTIVQLGTTYSNHSIKEGYAGDIDKLQQDAMQRSTTPVSKTLIIQPASSDELRHPYHDYEVTISDVKASVYSDDDRDGFFTHFSLNFDVDSHYGYQYVYAKIYLRKDDGDYNLFHVTDVFEIYDDLASDRYKVDSKLVSNFTAAYYDVRIEILVEGRSSVQDVVDASTHRSLYALPLEADRLDDGVDGDVIVHEHGGGAFSLPSVLALALFGITVRLLRRIRPV